MKENEESPWIGYLDLANYKHSELILCAFHFLVAIMLTVLILQNKENCDLYSEHDSTCHTIALINGGFFVMFWVFYFFTMHVHGIRGVQKEDQEQKDDTNPCIRLWVKLRCMLVLLVIIVAFALLVSYLIPSSADWHDSTSPSLHVWTMTHRILAGIMIMFFVRLLVAGFVLYGHQFMVWEEWIYFVGSSGFLIFGVTLFSYDVIDRSVSSHEPSKVFYLIIVVSGVVAVIADIVYYVRTLYLVAEAKGAVGLFRHRHFWRVMLWFVLLLVLTIVTAIHLTDYHSNYTHFR